MSDKGQGQSNGVATMPTAQSQAGVRAPEDGGGTPLPDGGGAPAIAGISALKGVILYGATLGFAGLYAYFSVKIFGAASHKQPTFDPAMISAAAALAGVLGSAFALEIGTPPSLGKTNHALATALKAKSKPTRTRAKIWRVFSLEAGGTETASWPKTFGIWVYALVATGVALTYVTNPNETPSAIKALAVAFGGYVIALINSAYSGSKQPAG